MKANTICLLWVSLFVAGQTFTQNSKQTISSLKKEPLNIESSTWMSDFNLHYHSKLITFHFVPEIQSGETGGLNRTCFIKDAITGFEVLCSKPLPQNAVMIVPFPSGADSLTVNQLMISLQNIHDAALVSGDRCYFITPQRRTDGIYPSSFQKSKLQEIKDSMIHRFDDEYTINFWDGFYDPSDTAIATGYYEGGDIHLNEDGHKELFNRVLEKNVFRLQSESLKGDIRTGQWFDILAPFICYFAILPRQLGKIRDRMTNPGN